VLVCFPTLPPCFAAPWFDGAALQEVLEGWWGGRRWGWAELSGFAEGAVGCGARCCLVGRGGGRPSGEEEEPLPPGATELLGWIKRPRNFIHRIDFMVSQKSLDTSLCGFPADY